MKMPYYAVAKGRHKGVYNNWSDCKNEVHNYSGALYKKFNTYEDAQSFVNGNHNSNRALSSALALSSKSASSSASASASGHSCDSTISSGSGPVVYTDGACSKNGFRGAKAGIGVYWGDDHPDNVSRPLSGRPTNNRAEIHAAITAIQQAKAKGYSDVTVVTDSQFLHNSVTKWMDNWIRKDWKLKDGSTVKNRDDFIELNNALNGIKVHWKWIRAHKGHHGNEMADKLAVNGINKSESPVL